MRAVIQRVSSASVSNEVAESNSISRGVMILLGIEIRDTADDIEYLTGKIARLRIFDDIEGVMNLSLVDVDGEVLVVSQFTLHAETKKGNRPSYIKAARPEQAIPLYEQFIKSLEQLTGKEVKCGWFGAHMEVKLVNDGPVTIIIDTRNKE